MSFTRERNDRQGKLISINNLSPGFEFYHICETFVNVISNNFILQICGYLFSPCFNGCGSVSLYENDGANQA